MSCLWQQKLVSNLSEKDCNISNIQTSLTNLTNFLSSALNTSKTYFNSQESFDNILNNFTKIDTKICVESLANNTYTAWAVWSKRIYYYTYNSKSKPCRAVNNQRGWTVWGKWTAVIYDSPWGIRRAGGITTGRETFIYNDNRIRVGGTKWHYIKIISKMVLLF